MTLTALCMSAFLGLAFAFVTITVLAIHARAVALQARDRDFGDYPLPSPEPRQKGVFCFRHPVCRETCNPLRGRLSELAALGVVFLLWGFG